MRVLIAQPHPAKRVATNLRDLRCAVAVLCIDAVKVRRGDTYKYNKHLPRFARQVFGFV